jgi:hypothetical protein
VARPPTDHTRISSPNFGSNRPAKSRSSLPHLCLTSRDFVPWRFLDAGQWSVRSAGVQKPAQKRSLRGYFLDVGQRRFRGGRRRGAPSQLTTNEKLDRANFAQVQANSSNVRSISRTILLTVDGSARSLEQERQPSVRRRLVGTFARTVRSRPQDRLRTGLTRRGRASVGSGQRSMAGRFCQIARDHRCTVHSPNTH